MSLATSTTSQGKLFSDSKITPSKTVGGFGFLDKGENSDSPNKATTAGQSGKKQEDTAVNEDDKLDLEADDS